MILKQLEIDRLPAQEIIEMPMRKAEELYQARREQIQRGAR